VVLVVVVERRGIEVRVGRRKIVWGLKFNVGWVKV